MAIAKAMAANGATIVFNDIKQELVDKGIAAYEEAGIKAHGYVCDVTDEDAVNAMVAKITEEVGHINILVNNAGIIKRIPMTEMSAAQFRQVIDVDLNAPFIVAKAIIPDKMCIRDRSTCASAVWLCRCSTMKPTTTLSWARASS